MMFWNGSQWAFWQVALMWIAMIAFWALLVWLVYYLVTGAIRDSRRGDEAGSAKRILDERLARGEIDVEEYGRLRAAMTANHRATAHVGSGQ